MKFGWKIDSKILLKKAIARYYCLIGKYKKQYEILLEIQRMKTSEFDNIRQNMILEVLLLKTNRVLDYHFKKDEFVVYVNGQYSGFESNSILSYISSDHLDFVGYGNVQYRLFGLSTIDRRNYLKSLTYYDKEGKIINVTNKSEVGAQAV